MKPVPLALLLASVLLTSHTRSGTCRPPRSPPVLLDGHGGFRGQLVGEVFLRGAAAGDQPASHLPGEKALKFPQRRHSSGLVMMTTLPKFPLDDGGDEGRVASRGAQLALDDGGDEGRVASRGAQLALDDGGDEGRVASRGAQVARGSSSWETEESAREAGEEELAGFLLSKRNNEPPISIDLTFHLLRNMLEMAVVERQRERALLNRKFLDEVGK